jgi:hypothetical protein
MASQGDVAFMLNFLGRTDEARPVWRELVAASIRRYGAGHETVLDNRRGLANALEPPGARSVPRRWEPTTG